MSTASRHGPVGRCRGLGGACAAHFHLGRGTQLLDLSAGGGEGCGALGIRVRRRLPQNLVARGGDFGGFRLGGLTLRDSLPLRRLRIVQQLGRRRAPLLDDRHHRAEQEPAQNPDEDEDVDRLQGQRLPVDPHRGRPI